MADGQPGRPTKYSPEMQQEICNLLERGWSEQAVCDAVGIHPDTLRIWKRDLPGFSGVISKAKQRGRGVLHDIIMRAAIGKRKPGTDEYEAEPDPKWASWMLTHRWPKEYSERRILEVAGKIGMDMQGEFFTLLSSLRSLPEKEARETVGQILDECEQAEGGDMDLLGETTQGAGRGDTEPGDSPGDNKGPGPEAESPEDVPGDTRSPD